MSATSRALALAIVASACIGSTSALAQSIDEKAQVCTACHGENGIPQDKTIPVIWGQHQGYVYLQLRDYKRGTRKNEQMSPIAEGLERNDMLALAEYFSKKTWPDLNQPDADPATTAKALRANASLVCSSCHLAEYQGDGTVPRLAGQSAEYLAKTLDQFRSRERANNPGMSDIASAASAEDIAALVTYLAGR
jgi:cytochrome c553